MALDLSALLGGGGGDASLNEGLGAVMPSGDSVFKKPMGDRTSWLTDAGLLTVSFLFDPKEDYDETYQLASITTDWMTALRDALCKQILAPEDIAPTEETIQEKKWKIVATMPMLVKKVFEDKKALEEYLGLVQLEVEQDDREEKALTKALQSQQFRFQFTLAIDAHQGEDRGSDEPGNRGVLHIFLEGSAAEEKEKAVAGGAAAHHGAAAGHANNNPAPMEVSAKGAKGKEGGAKQRPRSKSKALAENAELVIALREGLGISEAKWAQVPANSRKRFPETASLFFAQVSTWFAAQLTQRQQKIANSHVPGGLYQ